jgi:hypothetical protein
MVLFFLSLAPKTWVFVFSLKNLVTFLVYFFVSLATKKVYSISHFHIIRNIPALLLKNTLRLRYRAEIFRIVLKGDIKLIFLVKLKIWIFCYHVYEIQKKNLDARIDTELSFSHMRDYEDKNWTWYLNDDLMLIFGAYTVYEVQIYWYL